MLILSLSVAAKSTGVTALKAEPCRPRLRPLLLQSSLWRLCPGSSSFRLEFHSGSEMIGELDSCFSRSDVIAVILFFFCVASSLYFPYTMLIMFSFCLRWERKAVFFIFNEDIWIVGYFSAYPHRSFVTTKEEWFAQLVVRVAVGLLIFPLNILTTVKVTQHNVPFQIYFLNRCK